MKGIYIVFPLLYVVLVTGEVVSTKHEVTWDVSTDYSSWASGRTFKVGDQLVFKYTPGLHTAVELSSENEYMKCDTGSAKDTLTTGKDTVKLSKVGTRYFACGTTGHCDQGMKLKVKVVAVIEQASPSSSSPTDDTTAPTADYTPTSASSVIQYPPCFALVVALVSIWAVFVYMI